MTFQDEYVCRYTPSTSVCRTCVGLAWLQKREPVSHSESRRVGHKPNVTWNQRKLQHRVRGDCGLTSSLWAPSRPELLVGPSYCPEPKPEDTQVENTSAHVCLVSLGLFTRTGSFFISSRVFLSLFVQNQSLLVRLSRVIRSSQLIPSCQLTYLVRFVSWVLVCSAGVLTGIPCSCGLSSRLWSSFLEASIFSGSAASTM